MIYIKDDNTWKSIVTFCIKHLDVFQTGTSGWIKIDGSWVQFLASDTGYPNVLCPTSINVIVSQDINLITILSPTLESIVMQEEINLTTILSPTLESIVMQEEINLTTILSPSQLNTVTFQEYIP